MIKQNELLFKEFTDDLALDKKQEKTKKKHSNNVRFFIDYLEECMQINVSKRIDYIDDFFMYLSRKLSKTEKKEMLTSIKVFYKFMLKKHHINEDEHSIFLKLIKDNKEYWLEDDFF